MTLWTPSGEHPVDRPASGVPSEPAPSEPEPTPEERAAAEEYARQMDEMRRQLLELPAGVVVGQQALQFFDLAGLYLSEPTPRADDARVAIDALAAVVDRLGPRLGEAEAAVRGALHQAQLAFVEATRGAAAPGPAAGDEPGD